jgi:hypothetical protein
MLKLHDNALTIAAGDATTQATEADLVVCLHHLFLLYYKLNISSRHSVLLSSKPGSVTIVL